jgi:flagellar basal-body rod protein FlgF
VIYGLYHSAAGMLANQYRQDVIANNLANVDTASFKRDVPAFSERLIEAQRRFGATRNAVLDGQTGGVWSTPTATDWQAGPVEVTDHPLDAAIDGRGFFAVQTNDGVRYSRDGRFTINTQGQLVTAQDGLAVLNDQGAAIQVGADAKDVRLGAYGHLMVNGQTQEQLQVVDFDDAALRKIGRNLVTSDATPQPIAAKLRTNTIEKSNVDPMKEMVSMIEASRAYQLNAQMVSLQDGTLGRLVNEVSKPVG